MDRETYTNTLFYKIASLLIRVNLPGGMSINARVLMELLLFNFYITRLHCDIIKLGVSSPEIDYRLDEPVNYPTVSKTATVAFVLPLSR